MKRQPRPLFTRLCLGNLFCLLLFLNGVMAQTPAPILKKITGRILVSPGDKPVAGASIMIKGSQTGTQTDKDGVFTLMAKDGDVLVTSFIGYAPQEVRVGRQSEYYVRIEEADKSKLNDVVVIGYGQVRRKDLTGAISSISGEESHEIPAHDRRPGASGQGARA
jgi:hypothetical protein